MISRELRRLWPDGARLNLHQSTETNRAGIRLPLTDLARALGGQGIRDLSTNITVLVREGLIGDTWRVDVVENEPMAEVRPRGLGADFFLWGHGAKPVIASRLLDPLTELQFLTDIAPTPRATLMSPPAPNAEAAE